MTYDDGTLFERTVREISLSQRFRNNWLKLCDAFSLAVQLLSTSIIINSVSRPIGFILLVIYLTVLSILAILLVRNLTVHRNTASKNKVGLDMLDVIFNGRKYMKGNWYKVLFLVLLWAFLLAIFTANSNQMHWVYSHWNIMEYKKRITLKPVK